MRHNVCALRGNAIHRSAASLCSTSTTYTLYNLIKPRTLLARSIIYNVHFISSAALSVYFFLARLFPLKSCREISVERSIQLYLVKLRYLYDKKSMLSVRLNLIYLRYNIRVSRNLFGAFHLTLFIYVRTILLV